MLELNEVEKKIVDTALNEYAKKLDKLMAQCLKSDQTVAAEKVLVNIKIVNKLRDEVKEQ